jgi:hypothetical protein
MWLISGVVVGAAWLVKELGAVLLKDTASRLGRVGYVREDSELLDKVVDRDGQEMEIHYITVETERERELRFVATGHLFNESGTPLLLREPKVLFWGEDGLRVRHVNPELVVAGTLSAVITIPAHGTILIRVQVGVMVSELRKTYADAIPILELETTRGKVYRFPLKTSAMWRVGEGFVAWDSRRNKVVRAGTKEFVRARLRGSLGTLRGG